MKSLSGITLWLLLASLAAGGLAACGTKTRDTLDGRKVQVELEADDFIAQLDTAFRSKNWREGAILIESASGLHGPALTRWFLPRADRMPPTWLFAYARRLEEEEFFTGAARWYLIGRERLIYHALRCRDRTVWRNVTEVDGIFGGLRGVLATEPELAFHAIRGAFRWQDANIDTDEELLAVCASGERGRARWERAVLSRRREGDRVWFVLEPPPLGPEETWVKDQSSYFESRLEARERMKADFTRLLDIPKIDGAPPVR